MTPITNGATNVFVRLGGKLTNTFAVVEQRVETGPISMVPIQSCHPIIKPCAGVAIRLMIVRNGYKKNVDLNASVLKAQTLSKAGLRSDARHSDRECLSDGQSSERERSRQRRRKLISLGRAGGPVSEVMPCE